MKKKIVGAVAAVTVGLCVCGYELLRQQATQEAPYEITYIDEGEDGNSQQQKREDKGPDSLSTADETEAEQIVVKITDQGYVTAHGDHFHYYNGKVPYDAFISEELLMEDASYVLREEDIVNEVKNGYIIKVNGRYYLYLKDPKTRDQVRTREEIARQKLLKTEDQGKGQPEASETPSGYRTDDGYVFRPTDIIEDTGDGYIVPHGGHLHFIPKADLSATELRAAEAFWNGKKGRNHSRVPVPPKPSTPTVTELGQDRGQELQILLAQLEALPLSQRYHEADGLVFQPQRIVRKTHLGVVVPHGNHFHVIPYGQLSDLELRIVHLMDLPSGELPLPSVPEVPSPPPAEKEHHEIDFDVSQILSGDADGFVVQHGDHSHYFFRKDLTKEQIQAAEEWLAKKGEQQAEQGSPSTLYLQLADFSRDGSDEEKADYIAKAHGIPLEAVKISKDYFVFNMPDQAYDPTHIHPYAVLKKNVRLPLVTGDSKLDFLNELYTTALRSGVSPYRIKAEKGLFVVPHVDHYHYVAIQTEGAEEVAKEPFPEVRTSYQTGEYNQELVLAKVEAILAESARIYQTNPFKYRQIQYGLGQFVETMQTLASNSTAGYVAGLDAFAKQYVYGESLEETRPDSPASRLYNKLVKQVELLSFEKQGMNKQDFLKELQEASVQEDMDRLQKAERFLHSLDAFQKRPGIEGIDLLRYFYERAQDSRLSAETREEVAQTLIFLFQSLIESNQAGKIEGRLQALWTLRDRVESETATGVYTPTTHQTALDTILSADKTYREQIGRFLDEYFGLDALANQDSAVQASKKALGQLANQVRRVKDTSVRQHLQGLLQKVYSALYQPEVDLDTVLEEMEAIQVLLQHPERIGKANTEIVYSPEEIALAKELGRYTLHVGYIFEASDIVALEGDNYLLYHMGVAYRIAKGDLSESERQAAEQVVKERGLLATSSGEGAVSSSPKGEEVLSDNRTDEEKGIRSQAVDTVHSEQPLDSTKEEGIISENEETTIASPTSLDEE